MADGKIRFATWNVNSVRKRCGQVVDWLRESGTDVLCLQETKCLDEQFPAEPFEEIGYQCHVHGQKAYNGVAIVTRKPAEDIACGMPGYSDPSCRVIAATVAGIRMVSAYVPNGNRKGTEKFAYKLEWLGEFQSYLRAIVDSGAELLVAGDYNIAPADIDVYDPKHWGYEILTTPEERGKYAELCRIGLTDVYRRLNPEEPGFTWWDYRQGSFARNKGLRIDLALATEDTDERIRKCHVDDKPRGNDSPSDHTPVVVDIG